MARSFLLAMLVLVVFFLALVPAPLVLSAGAGRAGRPTKVGRQSLIPKTTRKKADFFKKHADDVVDVFHNVLNSFGDKKKGDKQDNAASSAGLYIFNISVGTPAQQQVAGVLDITLSFVWTQCESCRPCLAAPSFRWKASSTFSTVPCASQTCQSVINQTCPAAADCSYVAVDYGSGTNTTGYLGNDTFTFGVVGGRPVPIPGVLFGCSVASFGDLSGASGSFGFGRGPLSLVSQLQLSWFSYLLAPDNSDSSNLLEFSDDATSRPSNRGRSTPLVSNKVYPDLYYVKLQGIKVNDRDLTGIPAGTFDLLADGSGGVFLSTTTPVTYLEEAAYRVLREALAAGIASQPVNGSALGLDLCYRNQSLDNLQDKLPKLKLVFGGSTDTVIMELKKHNYFFADEDTGLECLTIMPSRGGSVLGSLLQAGTNMIYDIDVRQLIFETASAPPPHSKLSVLVLLAWVLLF